MINKNLYVYWWLGWDYCDSQNATRNLLQIPYCISAKESDLAVSSHWISNRSWRWLWIEDGGLLMYTVFIEMFIKKKSDQWLDSSKIFGIIKKELPFLRAKNSAHSGKAWYIIFVLNYCMDYTLVGISFRLFLSHKVINNRKWKSFMLLLSSL